jgi:hypothetical protein
VADAPLLPTFFVIGAAKSGTTSLHRYLAAHPEITMAEPKEPHLMIGPGWRERVQLYEQLFAPGAEIRGDASPGYSHLTVNPQAPRNIAELVPEARLLYLVRDPVERTIAHYAQHVSRGAEDAPIDVAVRPEDRDSFYLSASLYATVVESFLRSFRGDQLRVIDLEDLRGRRREVLRDVFAHVGADAGFWDDAFIAEHNVRGADNVRLPKPIARLQSSRLNRASRSLLPETLRRPAVAGARRLLGRNVRPEASPELRSRLAEALAPEAERLRELTGERFETWSV